MKPSLKTDWQNTTLVLGDLERWAATGRQLPEIDGTVFAGVDDLSTEFMALTGPSVVLSPLMMRGADVIEIATRLIDTGFAGCYRVVAMALPNPGIVRQEVNAVAPELDFDLIMIPSVLPVL